MNNPKWKEELSRIKTILDKSGLDVVIKWGADVYTWNGKNVVSYGGFKNYCTLWFYNGVFLKDKYKVLVNAQEGKTKSLRQWRFTSMVEINEKRILEYVREAVTVEEKELKVKPEKSKPLATPDLLAKTFKTDKAVKTAFEKLTPGRQKEYILYINEAKQDETKLKRIDKITPMILQGIGLNDKYK